MRVKSASWRKRHAIQIASQLPENIEDALAVLDYVRELVTVFLNEDRPKGDQARVLAFSRSSEIRSPSSK